MKGSNKIVLFVVLAVVLLLLVNPQWFPFLGSVIQGDIATQLQENFGNLFVDTGMLTPGKLISAAAAAIFVWLINIVICWFLELFSHRSKHTRSMAGLFTSLTNFICVIVGAVWALGILGVNLTGIFASLGIASLIVGFGAQSLIEDAITGIFIIFEGQYHVGDIIVLDDFRGTVKSIGIRTTSIEDAGGNLKIVNNSDIRNLQNRSRNDSVAVCDVGISYDASIEQVEEIMKTALPEIYSRHTDLFLEVPIYAGVEALADSAVVLRFTVKVTEENFFVGRRVLTRDLKLLLDKHGIEIPFTQIVLHQSEK